MSRRNMMPGEVTAPDARELILLSSLRHKSSDAGVLRVASCVLREAKSYMVTGVTSGSGESGSRSGSGARQSGQ